MTRPNFRRSLRFENLESREVLSGPSAQQQYMLELVNYARTNPAAMADRVTSNLTPDVQATLNYYNVDLNAVKQAIATSPAKPPVAWSQPLADAAQGHSQDMANTKVQTHAGSDGSTIDSRIKSSGLANITSTGENAYAYGSSVDETMQAFLLDWGVADQGHRRNLLQANVSSDDAYNNVGIGIVNTGNNNFGPMVVTQDFAKTSNAQAQIVGAAFNDNQGTRLYAPGEGVSGVQIDAVNQATGARYSTTSMDAGGYQLAVPAGNYQVSASVNNTVVKVVNMNVGTQNVMQDFILTDSWDGRSRDQILNAANPAPNPMPVSVTRASVAMTPMVAAVSAPTPAPTPTPTPVVVTPVVVTPTIAPVSTPVVPILAASLPTVSTVTPTTAGSWTSWKAKLA